MENDYHNPYDHRAMAAAAAVAVGDGGQPNHYEAPSCLVRNPSGTLFIPSSGKCKFKDWISPGARRVLAGCSPGAHRVLAGCSPGARRVLAELDTRNSR
jgi:hypothetical protein